MARYVLAITLIALFLTLSLLPVPVSAGQISGFSPQRVAVIQPEDRSEEPRLLVTFDLSTIASQQQIDFAQLLFRGCFLAPERDTPLCRLEIYPLSTDWQHDSVTWQTPWDQPGGDIDSCARMTNWVSAGEVDTSFMWLDVTRIVTSWRDGSRANCGILVKISDVTPAVIQHIDVSSVELRIWHHGVHRP
jgi:hypothetical protein